MRITVAIDGPAGAGKSTIAKLLADKFNLMYINTGAMYRAVTLKAMRNNLSIDDVDSLCKMIDSMNMYFDGDKLIVDNEDISNEITMPYISNSVSLYASIAEIRSKLVDIMRDMSKKYNVIMDGRDIGTVVLKDAQFKFYLTASAEQRAQRRYDELTAKGVSTNYDTVLQDIIKRDYLDSNREVSPLTKAKDAIEIDSSYLSIQQVVGKMYEYINSQLKGE